MAKLDTQTWEVKRLSRFEVRVTPKKLYIDRINLETGKSDVAFYVQVQEQFSVPERGVVKKYWSSMPYESYSNTGTSIELIVRFIKDRFDIDVPQEAVDLFESRNLMRELCSK